MFKNLFLKKDLVCLVIFFLFLILPACYSGFTNKTIAGLPSALTYFHKLFFLFPHSITWPVSYIQARLNKNGEWTSLEEKAYFRLEPFGHRNRTARLWELCWGKEGFPAREELALWIKERYFERHKIWPLAVRFVIAWWRPRLRGFDGSWQKPALDSFSQKDIYVLSIHE